MFSGALRRQATVSDARGFCQWAGRAEAGDGCIYHIGNLVADRASHPELHLLAETVLLFQEGRYVLGQQLAVHLPTVKGRAYSVIRTGAGRAPRSVLSGALSATQYRALEAIRTRASAVSVTRAVRDALALSETHAKLTVAALRKRGWVVEQPARGWEVSPTGLKLLL